MKSLLAFVAALSFAVLVEAKAQAPADADPHAAPPSHDAGMSDPSSAGTTPPGPTQYNGPSKPGGPPSGAYVLPLQPKNPFDIKGDDIDQGGDVTKACRYDEPEWSNCDPFEMIRFRTLRLVSGGRQCEEVKNMTERCSPYQLPAGTKWLIEEHRKCISELKRLKIMIADLSKYITNLREKGQELFNSYLQLKKHLEELKNTIENLQKELEISEKKITSVRKELEEWKEKARDLQSQLDEIKAKYHDLQQEVQECEKNTRECVTEGQRCRNEIQHLSAKLHDLTVENTEWKRRLMDSEKYKDQLVDVKEQTAKFEAKNEKLGDKLEEVKDAAAQCKLDLINAQQIFDDLSYKDTHMDLSMEMWITHNKSDYTYKPYEFSTTTAPYTYAPEVTYKCLISYYGVTNETCWYKSNTESVEEEAQDAIGEHAVEAHWKYFTFDAKDQYECDKAAHLHYEFLINRCKPEHHLPVLSVYRPDEHSTELSTHIYPKPNIPQPGQPNRCWITFLGPHGHCERRKEKYPLYNTDDTIEGYRHGGSGVSKSKCLARAKIWSDYCENPVVATYIPEGVSSAWRDIDIAHDNHGGRMFEESSDVKHQINPHSINPHNVVRPNIELPEALEDTPEFRKAMNLRGAEKERVLKELHAKMGQTKGSAGIKWHGIPAAAQGQAPPHAPPPAPVPPPAPAAAPAAPHAAPY